MFDACMYFATVVQQQFHENYTLCNVTSCLKSSLFLCADFLWFVCIFVFA